MPTVLDSRFSSNGFPRLRFLSLCSLVSATERDLPGHSGPVGFGVGIDMITKSRSPCGTNGIEKNDESNKLAVEADPG